ncbi:MAG: hypothetical protein H7Y00_15490 [Fimbriimonadaceae bacterium]|nr:hypothetical protein [Chitinophagales bacterium]
MQFLFITTISVGGWALLNGILHDIFILRSDHGKQYDRTLLRLLMDGHILITCGVLQVIAAFGLKNNEDWGFLIAGVSCISLLIYCAMIFPFLKSLGMIMINLVLLILLLINYF